VDALALDISVPLRSFRLDLALTVDPGTTTALVGPSGAGKSTVLGAVAGLVRPDRGWITLGAHRLLDAGQGIDLPPEQRRVGLVFQDYALFPHMTVLENVSYGGKQRATELLRRLGIADLGKAKPAALSGGERQRVGLARALARDPDVLLLDEPLSAVDALTRNALRAELQALLRTVGLPTLLVTHDFEDASALADRVGVIAEGRILQLGRHEDLVAAPANEFVASFTGGNLLPGTAARGEGLTAATLVDGSVVYSTDEVTGPVGVVVFPWEITLSRNLPEGSALNHVAGTVTSIVPLGNRTRVRVGPIVAEITGQSAERLALERGERAVATFKASSTRLLPRFADAASAATDEPGLEGER
jgi:ABC-type sulfate/molybdate transport systems ATPase subunit